VLVHLAQGGVLAPYQGDIVYGDLIKPEDEFVCSVHGILLVTRDWATMVVVVKVYRNTGRLSIWKKGFLFEGYDKKGLTMRG
jgi:hypothetical protein